MLRITAQSNASAATHYFDTGHDYYLDGSEQTGQWGGKGARLLGLSGSVQPEDFKALAYNRDPGTGERLTSRDHANRRVGYDFTFSVPKSVTLAYELLQDERILEAFKKSVAETMADIERDALTRDRRGGKEDLVHPGNLTHATFIHRSSRPVNGVPDCQLHAHAFVFNATKYDGRWTAVELGEVKANAPYYEALAMGRLGKSLVDMGYGVRRKGKFFELEGVSDELVAKFSTRTKLIEAVAAEKGITNPDYKAELGGKTREHKSESHHSPAELRKLWVSRLTQDEKYALLNLPGQEKPLPSVEQSAAFAIEHSFHNEAVRPTKRVLEEGLRHGVGTVTLERLGQELDRAGLLTKADECTTRHMLDLEAGMIQFARDTKGTWKASCADRKPAKELNSDQRKGVRHIWRSQDGVTAVRGAAGVGKTYALREAANGIRDAGFAVQALAQSNEAVKELVKEGVDPRARTIASFLMSDKAQEAVRGGTVIVDESSLVGTVEMAKLFDVLKRVGARAVLVGDDRQHSSVSAGAPVRLLHDLAGVKPVEITEILRQKDARYKAACELFSKHDILGGMDALEAMGCVHEVEQPYRVEALVQDYLAETSDGRDVLVISPTHAEAKGITDGIRAGLKGNGTLKGEEREFDRLVNLGWSEAERKEARHKPDSPQAKQVKELGLTVTQYGVYRPETIGVAVGDSLRATGGFTDANGRKVTNGMQFKALGFTAKGMRAETESGIKLVIPPDAKHLAHNYVRTSFSGQGKTADVVLVAESSQSFPAADRAQMYVSASRGRYAIRVYTDDVQALREAVDRDRKKMNAHDLVGDQFVRDNEKVSPVKARSRFVSRIKQIAGKVKEQVSQQTQRKEKAHDLEIDR